MANRRSVIFWCLPVMLGAFLVDASIAGGVETMPVEASMTAVVETRTVRATVINPHLANGIVLLQHEEIEGFMPAMTMPFIFETPAVSKPLSYHDVVEVDFYQRGNSFVIRHLSLLDKAGREPVITSTVDPTKAIIPWASVLEDSHGRSFSLTSYKDNLLVVNFIYTRCSTICPAQSVSLRSLYEQLTSEQLDQVRFISITLDPEHDSPQVLREYARRYGYEKKNWRFVGGDTDAVKRVLNSFNIMALPRASTEIHHTTQIYLIESPEKEVRVYAGTASGLNELHSDLELLTNDGLE